MILKIQRPIENNQDRPVLAYSHDRSFREFIEFSDELKALMGDRPRVFVEAERKPDGYIEIIQEVPAQAW